MNDWPRNSVRQLAHFPLIVIVFHLLPPPSVDCTVTAVDMFFRQIEVIYICWRKPPSMPLHSLSDTGERKKFQINDAVSMSVSANSSWPLNEAHCWCHRLTVPLLPRLYRYIWRVRNYIWTWHHRAWHFFLFTLYGRGRLGYKCLLVTKMNERSVGQEGENFPKFGAEGAIPLPPPLVRAVCAVEHLHLVWTHILVQQFREHIFQLCAQIICCLKIK